MVIEMFGKIGRNDPCWCGSGRKYKVCHEAFDEKINQYARMGHIVPKHNIIKTPQQIEKIKESCKINIAILDYLEKNIHEGMNTAEIDQIVAQGTAHQELHRQIINGLGILFLVFLVGIQPLINNHIL